MSETTAETSAAVDPIALGLELERLGVYTESTAAESAFARCLVLGAAKTGKTTCVVKDAPKPLIINCDGMSATKGARNQGAKFLQFDVGARTPRADWKRAIAATQKLVADGHVRTVLVDTVSVLSDNMVDDISATLEGFDIWNELQMQLVGGMRKLFDLAAHVFMISHIVPDWEGSAGILPAIAGKSAKRIPQLVDDWILLDVEAGRKPHERMWVIGPQAKWTASGRNIRRSTMIEASTSALLDELGLDP